MSFTNKTYYHVVIESFQLHQHYDLIKEISVILCLTHFPLSGCNLSVSLMGLSVNNSSWQILLLNLPEIPT